jgi:hypothetical protein
MRTPSGSIDFARTEEYVRTLTRDQIAAALDDIRKTLPSADARDRQFGSNCAGYYRDEASVLRAELARRVKHGGGA